MDQASHLPCHHHLNCSSSNSSIYCVQCTRQRSQWTSSNPRSVVVVVWYWNSDVEVFIVCCNKAKKSADGSDMPAPPSSSKPRSRGTGTASGVAVLLPPPPGAGTRVAPGSKFPLTPESQSASRSQGATFTAAPPPVNSSTGTCGFVWVLWSYGVVVTIVCLSFVTYELGELSQCSYHDVITLSFVKVKVKRGFT